MYIYSSADNDYRDDYDNYSYYDYSYSYGDDSYYGDVGSYYEEYTGDE